MAEQNIAYASQDSILETLVLHTLPDFGPDGTSGIINNNFLLSFLKDMKRFDIMDGGLEIWGKVRTKKNTNLGWQGHEDEMSTNLQDPSDRLRYDIQTYAGAGVVLNKKHEAMNKGRAMIKNFAKELRDQAEDTIPNDFNSGFWNSSPGALEPNSIPSLISITPTTGTIGGQNRSSRKAFQNGLNSDTIADIGSEAGLSALFRMIIRQAVTAKDRPDLVMMDDELWAGLSAFLDAQRRFKENDHLANLGFDSIYYRGTTIGYENTNVMDDDQNTIPSGYVYGINSKYLKFKVLRDGNFQWDPDGFVRMVGQTLNKALYFYVFCNLCDYLPRSHFVMSDVSTT